MNDHPVDSEHIDAIAEDFLQRYRLGEHPSLTEYANRYPTLATEIRELFPAIVALEQLRPTSDGGPLNLSNTPSRDRDFAIPEELGEYRIVREIGRGGMGIVYEAEQRSLGRRVALKVLPPHAIVSGNLLRRFEHEAKSAARLHHTNIVPVFAVGAHQGLHYYAMQYIDGQALDQVLAELRDWRARFVKQGAAGSALSAPTVTRSLISEHFEIGNAQPSTDSSTLSQRPNDARPTSRGEYRKDQSTSDAAYFRNVARLVAQAADGLAYAHAQGVIHRDIKPSNLLLDVRGTLWITDFGLAKQHGSDLTSTGDLLGTLRYVSPERLTGQVDARCDIYALGATLYEMLTLTPAYGGTDRVRLIHQITYQEPPRPRSIEPRIPGDLETIVLKALEKEPERRYQTARELADDLGRFLACLPISAKRVSTWGRFFRWCRRNPMIAALSSTVAVLVASFAVFISFTALRLNQHLHRVVRAESESRSRLYDSLVAQAKVNRLSGQPGQRFATLDAIQQAHALLSESTVAPASVLASRSELRDLASAALSLVDARVIREWPGYLLGSQPSGTSAITFDMDLNHYARCDQTGKISIRTLRDDHEVVALPGHGRGAVGMRFSKNDDRLAVNYWIRGREGNIFVWDWRERRIVFRSTVISRTTPEFSPDDRLLAVPVEDGVAVYDLSSSTEIERCAAPSRPQAVAFDPTGRRLAMAIGNQVRIAELVSGTLPAPNSGVGSDLGIKRKFSHAVAVTCLAWHPQGRMLAAGGKDGTIYLWDTVAGQQHAALTSHRLTVVGLSYTSSGDLLHSWSWDATSKLWDPWTGDLKLTCTGNMGRLNRNGDALVTVQGNRLSFWAITPSLECRSLPYQGSRFTSKPHYLSGSVSPDGRMLALGGGDGVRLWDLEEFREVALLPIGRTIDAVFNPTGRALVTSGSAGVHHWPIDTVAGETHIGPPRRLLGGTDLQHLGIDGQGAVLAVGASRGTFLIRADQQPSPQGLSPQGLRPEGFLEHKNVTFSDVSPDGRWVATSTWHGEGVRIWDAANGELVRQLLEGVRPVHTTFSPDGKWLVATTFTDVSCWEVGTWTKTWSHPRQEPTLCAAFRPDGQYLAISNSPQVELIDPVSGRVVVRLETRLDDGFLAFVPGSDRLVSVTNGPAQLRVWDLKRMSDHLVALGLDWVDASSNPSVELAGNKSLRVEVDLGTLSPKAPKPD